MKAVVGVFATSSLGQDNWSIAVSGDEDDGDSPDKGVAVVGAIGEDGDQEDADTVGGGEERNDATAAAAGNAAGPTSIAATAPDPADTVAVGSFPGD